MLVGTTSDGNLKNVKVNNEGNLLIKGVTTLDNTDENPVPVKEVKEAETTLLANVLTVGTEATEISVGKKVSNIMVANYSETADITINSEDKNFQVGANLALELSLNTNVNTLSITSTEADTKVQLVVKGVE